MRRRWLIACDLFFTVALAAAYLLCATPPASAYVDPSVMTYTIQALAGVVVALSAVFGVAFRRTRRMLFRLLHIDENAGKEVEPDVHRLDASDADKPVEVEKAAEGSVIDETNRKVKTGRLSWGRRIACAFAIVGFLVFTVFVVAPYEIAIPNTDSLVFGAEEIGPIIAIGAAAIAVVAALLVSLLRGRAFDITLIVICSLSIAAYVQALFLNSGLPTANGTAVQWGDYTSMMVISGAVWLALIVVPLVVSRRNRPLWRRLAVVVSLCLILVEGVGLVGLFTGQADKGSETEQGVHLSDEALEGGDSQSAAENGKAENRGIHVTEDGMLQLAPDHNVVVFVLDTFDTQNLESLLADDPGLLDPMTDFTFFSNSTGSMIPTAYAVPYLLTGQLPSTDQTFSEYLDGRYGNSDYLDTISAQGYSIGLYSDSLGIDYSTDEGERIAGETVNLHRIEDPAIDRIGTFMALEKCALYRDVPWVLKRYFWFYTDEINRAMLTSGSEDNLGEVDYRIDDASYYQLLCDRGLAIADDEGAGAFRFYHLEGAHAPYTLGEDASDQGVDGSDLQSQSRGSLHIVFEYLDQLKKLGLYDSTTIIVTADHGEWYLTPDPLVEPSSPIILVKPAKDDESAGESIDRSDMPVDQSDLLPTVLQAVGADPSTVGSGSTVFDIDDPARTRYYLTTTSDGHRNIDIVQYEIDGGVLDFSNWHLTGKTWACDDRGSSDHSSGKDESHSSDQSGQRSAGGGNSR